MPYNDRLISLYFLRTGNSVFFFIYVCKCQLRIVNHSFDFAFFHILAAKSS